MMGHSHAVSGGLLFAAASGHLPVELVGPGFGPADLLMGTVLCAGAALLPDLDHHDSTLAHFLGPVSGVLCRVLGRVSGGHRHATHSLLFAALAGAGTWAGIAHLGRGFVLGLTFCLLALALRALHLHPPGNSPATWALPTGLAALGAAGLDSWLPNARYWLPCAVTLGVLAHLLGDFLTRRGIPLFWPYGRRYEIPLIKRTGNGVETKFLAPLMTIATFVLLWCTVFPGTLPIS
ncbi:metal-dependent hydrolase [Kitasatospora sp. NPDC005748]|uniref:metal-dependent hydrolase n=1 Tax=Kitasatospora sp. NPDC005748 TaxID=3157063 RepID=UPI0033F051C9